MKNYILDTNVLLHDPNSLLSFEENSVLIPIETVVVFESVFEGGVGLTYEPLGIYDLNGE